MISLKLMSIGYSKPLFRASLLTCLSRVSSECIIWAVAISSDNRWLVTIGDGATARLWNLSAMNPATNPVILRGHEGWVRAVAISPDNRWLAPTARKNTARLWLPARREDFNGLR